MPFLWLCILPLRRENKQKEKSHCSSASTPEGFSALHSAFQWFGLALKEQLAKAQMH